MQNAFSSPRTIGRAAKRFTQLLMHLVSPLAMAGLSAQSAKPAINVRDVGAGTETWVLLSGTLGGIAGMHRLETRLLATGARVISIDIYALSVDSADVSFAAMARRVDATLEYFHVDHAHIVGHAHGGGVGLRLAASFPNRVATLDLLDVGALPANRTATMSGAIGLAPLVSRMPGGRAFIRTQLVSGIRENSGTTQWFDSESERAYTQPVLDNVSKAVAMAERLGKAQELESVDVLVSRIRVPVTVILGQSPHPAAPPSEQLMKLATLGSRLRVVTLKGVGHFPHEEAPDQVMRALSVVVVSTATENKQ